MVTLKLPSFKGRTTRKPSSAHPHANLLPAVNKSKKRGVHTQAAAAVKASARTPALLSTLRSSLRSAKLFTKGGASSLGFLTGTRKPRSSQKPRKIIHVATLNFGPFEDFTPEVAMHLSRRAPQPPSSEACIAVFHRSDPPTAEGPTSHSEESLVDSPLPPTPVGDTTMPSIYSRDSWVDVGYLETPEVATILSPTLFHGPPVSVG